MKIASIALTNFRVYESAEVEFDQPLSIVRAANHSGKSSLKQAIEVTLTKRTEGTTAAGAGADDKIRLGAKKAEVTVNLETKKGPVQVQMIQKPGSRNYSVTPGFDKYLAANGTRLSCCLDSDYFISRPEDEQKAILSALIAPTSYDFDKEMVTLAEEQLGIIDWTEPPVKVIDTVYDKAYKARTAAKNVLDGIRVPQPVAMPDYTVKKIEEFLDKLRDQLQEEAESPVAAVDTRQLGNLEAQLQQREVNLRKDQDLRKDAQARITQIDADLLPGPQMTKLKKAAQARTEYATLQTKIDEQRAIQRQEKKDRDTYEQLRLIPQCPTCSQPITTEFLERAINIHRERCEAAVETEQKLLKEQSELPDFAEADRKIGFNETLTREKLEQIKVVTATGERITQVGKEIVDLNRQIEAEKAKVAGPAPVIKDLSGLKAKIEGWEKQLGAAMQYDAVQRQIETETERRAEQQEKVHALEKLCAHFGKDGVRAELIQEHIAAFEQSVNGVLRVWGYEAQLNVEPYSFTVATPKGPLPLKELSGSERMMFGVALQAAIAVHAKISLIVIDRADVFINGERGRLFTILRTMLEAKQLDQAIVFVSDERRNIPDQPGVAFYYVAEGRIERLGRTDQERAA